LETGRSKLAVEGKPVVFAASMDRAAPSSEVVEASMLMGLTIEGSRERLHRMGLGPSMRVVDASTVLASGIRRSRERVNCMG
jgi:hypothetical protein